MLRLLKVRYNLVHHHKPATNATLVLGWGGGVSEWVCLDTLVFRTRYRDARIAKMQILPCTSS